MAFDIGDLGLGVLTNSLELGELGRLAMVGSLSAIRLGRLYTCLCISSPVNSLTSAMRPAGCDCLGSIHYFDALMANSKGASLLRNSSHRLHVHLSVLVMHVKTFSLAYAYPR